MPFIANTYLDSLSAADRALFQHNHLSVGYHPDTEDKLYLPDIDRYSGLYVLGLPGSGKSGFLQNLITADIAAKRAVIVIDPHGDLVTSCLATIPAGCLSNTFLLDMEDEAYPFGVNIFHVGTLDTAIAQAGTIDKLMHIFEVLWADVLSQQNLPRYVRAAAITLLANPGATLVDMHHFLIDTATRQRLLANVTDPTVQLFWKRQYDDLRPDARLQRVQPLIGRLEALFMGRSLVTNIVGQRQTTINFRQAIEAKRAIFIKLPMKTIAQDARLIGTILLAQIHAAIFSFADTPADKRPGVSLYVDEFAHFSTPDFSELFTEARKYGLRLTIAHQYRGQLPSFLQDSTMAVRTKVCFQLTPDDGREMAHLFPATDTVIKPEDIEPHVCHHLLTRTPDDNFTQTFVDTYLRPLQGQKRGNRVEIQTGHLAPSVFDIINGGRSDNPRLSDPTPYLDNVLYQAMKNGDAFLLIPPEAVKGFANCGQGFYKQSIGLSQGDPILSSRVCFPPALVVATPGGGLRWTRRPEGGTEQLYHFIFHLRMVMQLLVESPIGKTHSTSAADVGKMLTQLPKRAAFIRSGDTVGVIYTHDTPPAVPVKELYTRAKYVLAHTRAVYCTPRAKVEQSLIAATPVTNTAVPNAAPIQPGRWEETDV